MLNIIKDKRKLLKQVNLEMWFRWVNKNDPQAFDMPRGSISQRKCRSYFRFLHDLKETQQDAIEEELWREIHGDGGQI